MLVVAMLAAPTPSPGHYGTLDHPIAHAARAWFTPFIDHPAVATVRRLFYVESDLGSGFACDAVTGFVLRRNEPPDLTARYPYSESALACANGIGPPCRATLRLLSRQSLRVLLGGTGKRVPEHKEADR